MRAMGIGLGVVLLALSMTTAASDWQAVATVDKFSIEMDVASLIRDSTTPAQVRGWTRRIFAEPQESERYKTFRSVLMLIVYDCDARGLGVMEATYFTDTQFQHQVGDTVHIDPSEFRWVHPSPDTVGETDLDFACQHAPPM